MHDKTIVESVVAEFSLISSRKKMSNKMLHIAYKGPSGQNGDFISLSKNRYEDKLLSFAKAHDNNDE